jgi:sugar O-acyltransferase (sialic acid O-acetyltransferase NeuD family)
MKRLAIVGSGDLGQQIAYHAKSDGHYTPVGFFDDAQEKRSVKHGLQIFGGINDIHKSFSNKEFDVLMIGLGYRHFNLREQIYDDFSKLIPFGSIVHTSAFIDPSCKIGVGVFIYPGCILDMNVEVHDNVLINVGCVIAHDTIIAEHSFLSPSVKIAGFVSIGRKVSLGISTTIIDNVRISDEVRTGGGAVVTKNLESPGLYVGIPASFKKI